MTQQEFAGKIALVTGSTGGVGLYAARRMLEGGAHVVINSRTEESGGKALAELRQTFDKVSLAVGDCGEYDQAKSVSEQAAAINGGIDVVVSAGAAGKVKPMPFAEMTGEEIAIAYSTRLLPRIYPVHASLPYLRVRGGSVVMLCTDAGRFPTPGESIMGAVGAGVILMTKTLAKEFARWGIRVNSVAMTLTSDTPSWDRIFASDGFQNHLFDKLNGKFPLGRAPTADEVARVAVFLASEGAAQVTGQTVSANGGLSFGGW
jgi:2-hydroxycyclohexanecarboxyl-CoA dehydrogenase